MRFSGPYIINGEDAVAFETMLVNSRRSSTSYSGNLSPI
jgi:hypothetical protein